MSAGTGRGPITADGCPVELYLHFPHLGEADLIHATVPPGAHILDLGCGTGRLAHPLIALGHPVTAVDSSADMLAHVRGAETVHAEIAGLELGRRFDVVLMASHLVNTPDDGARHALLAAAARHVAPAGLLIAELYPLRWFDEVVDRSGGHIGDVEADLTDVRRDGDVVSATIRYRLGDEVWTQTFSARRLDDAALRAELAHVGLAFGRWLRADRSWFTAVTHDLTASQQ
jgi:SAM-dependent methyltransferase